MQNRRNKNRQTPDQSNLSIKVRMVGHELEQIDMSITKLTNHLIKSALTN
jgi:hypothetical protein